MLDNNFLAKKANTDIYEYVFTLEEQVRTLLTEKQLNANRSTQLEQELKRLRDELNELRNPPLLIGSVQEIIPEGLIVRNSNGLEFLVTVNDETRTQLRIGNRVAMTQRSLSVVHVLSEAKDPRVKAMEVIHRPQVTFDQIGGLTKEIRELEEAVIFPLTHPLRFQELGIPIPSGVLLHGLPGTGKTLLAKAVANKTKSTFIGLTGSELVRKYIGEGARLVRDVFKMAKEKKSAIIFIDEIDSIGAHRMDDGSGGDREVQRTLMQLLSEMDGFRDIQNVKIIAATNRIDILDPALLRAGRFDRIIEVPTPSDKAREEIFKIHTKSMKLSSAIDFSKLAVTTSGMTGADIRAVCMEAGILTLRTERKSIDWKDFQEAIEKVRTNNFKSEDMSPSQKMFA